jgi:hyperosmotically inducible protein
MRDFTIFLLGATTLLAVACRTNESPERQVDDAQIIAQVKSKLASDIGLSTVTNISVNSTNGIVTLTGQVDSADAKAKAEAAAKSVPKVVRVIDNLQVASSALTPTDRRPRTGAYNWAVPRNYCSAAPRRT